MKFDQKYYFPKLQGYAQGVAIKRVVHGCANFNIEKESTFIFERFIP